MSNKLKVMVLYGGKSGEHEISLLSAAYVLSSLDPEKYEIIPVAMDKLGFFHLHDYQDLKACKDKLPVMTDKSRKLTSILSEGQINPKVDVVFPIVHGPLYEDGCLQGILELSDVAFVGCDVLSSALGMDKDVSRRLVNAAGIAACAKYKRLSWFSSSQERQHFCNEAASELGWPMIVKPCSLGSSVGTHKVSTLAELAAAVEDALRYDEEILVEEFLVGQEIELAVLENKNPSAKPRVSLAGEIKVHHSDGFYSYAAKYLESQQTELIIPASLGKDLLLQLQEIAASIFMTLKCKGLARVDFFVNQTSGKIYFNEINTMPGFTAISMYPKLWEKSQIEGEVLMDELVDLALIHHRCRQNLVTNYL